MKIEVDLKITDEAVREFKRSLSEVEGPESAVRISVQGGGCSGFRYGLGFVADGDIDPKNDVVEEIDGLKVVVDKRSLMSLDGAIVEWVDTPDQKGFRFQNPNAKKTCGCSKNASC